MMLDNFFTLTEMNHGLTSPSRVMELVAVMQKGRSGTVNVGDTIRQWSAVASAIAATENKDCLDLFIQLDGVQFIDKWLKDVQKFNNDSDKSFPEETIIHLLEALETLHMSYENLIASEIWVTVEDLLVHGSSKLQGKARLLFESWKCKRDGVDSVSAEKVGALSDDEMDESEHVQRGCDGSKSPSRYSSLSCDFSGLEKGQDSTTDEQVPPTVSEALHPGPVFGACNSNKILDSPNGDDRASDQVVPPLSEPSVGFSTCESVGTTLVESCITAVPRQDMHDGLAEFSKLESTGDLIHARKIECSSEKLISLEESKKSEYKASSSSTDVADANNSVMEHEKKNSCDEGPPFIDSKKIDSGGKDTDDGSHENKCRSSSLDLSCQVSIEVVREAVDSEEQSFSSEKPPDGNIRQPDNLDPVNANQSHDSRGLHMTNIPELTAEASPVQKFAACIENPGMAQTSSPQDMETSQVTEVAHEEASAEKAPCKFDLNQEVCSEDIDCSENQTGATSILSASGEVAAPGLPVSPVQFEGNLGWKGSVDKSDFLPASLGQSTKSNEDLTVGVISSTPKPPRGFREIDLNVTESGDGNTRDLLHYKHVPVYSSLPSGESSVETDSRKSERHDLDLNLTSEDDGVPSDWRTGHLFPQENDQHQSHSSSASSMQPLSIIDLNDQPNFPNDSYDISCLSNVNVSGGTETDGFIISIMGARVKINPKDPVPQTIPFPNGRTPEHTFDVKVGRTETCFAIGSVLPYAHSSVYGYNNVAPVPAVAALPFSSSSYGSGLAIPYIVDSRRSPIIPQIAGDGFSQRPFVLNIMSSIPVDGASGSSFDLNSGVMIKDGGREPLVLRDFLNLGPVNLMDDQLTSNTLPTVGSDISGKRKEPDNGLEHYPFRNYTPPWK
ncbi:uncharacterized protein [Primulina eburnea]|uniref:uncharacterized protein n=1 Tax=Primulina eburnea TaxID=1245227 RepID=UPI003C6C4F94